MALTDTTARADVLMRYGLTDEVDDSVVVTVYRADEVTLAQTTREYVTATFYGNPTTDAAMEVVLVGSSAATAFTDPDGVYTEWTGS